jgi:hypothetical protein
MNQLVEINNIAVRRLAAFSHCIRRAATVASYATARRLGQTHPIASKTYEFGVDHSHNSTVVGKLTCLTRERCESSYNLHQVIAYDVIASF